MADNTSSILSPWRVALAAALALYWLSLWDALRIDWATNSQYAYGWSVPFIAVCFFIQRWLHLPPGVPLPDSQRRLLPWLLAMVALLQFPLRLVEEANAEWRLLFWCREAQCVALTLGVIALAGGWRWVRHFSFPVLFTATAVPWSKFIEDPLTQKLMHVVASVTVEGMFLLKIPALQKGNLVQLTDGIVGVGEVCSGIRSLQSSIMLALVAGELWQLAARRRWGIVFLAIFSALVFNSLRTFALVHIAATHGFLVMQHCHDTLGTLEMCACILVIFGTAYFLKSKDTPKASIQPSPGHVATVPPAELPSSLLRLTMSFAAIWIVAEISTQAWYKLHDATVVPQWTIAAPQPGTPGFPYLEMQQVSEDERAQLRTNDCLSFKWAGDDDLAWTLTFLRWPTGRSSEACVTAHRPDLCLPAAGFEFVREYPQVEITANGVPMLFHHYLFESNDKNVHVFYLLSDLKTAGFQALESDLSLGGRYRAALSGRRNNRRAILEVTATGGPNDAAIVSALTAALEKVVSPVSLSQSQL